MYYCILDLFVHRLVLKKQLSLVTVGQSPVLEFNTRIPYDLPTNLLLYLGIGLEDSFKNRVPQCVRMSYKSNYPNVTNLNSSG